MHTGLHRALALTMGMSLLLLMGAMQGCGGTATPVTQSTAAQPAGPPTLAELQDYKQWLKMNSSPIQGRTHGLTDIYVNQDRQTIAPEGTLDLPFPDGTVIVKQVLEAGLVAVMQKVAGSDPKHGDWKWIEYRPDGTIAGEDSLCWGCHLQAEGSDWVFTKLETP